MDTQPTEAVANDASVPVETATEAFENIAAEWLGDDEQEPAEDAEEQSEATEGAEDELELEAEDDDLPPIEAPVSWDAEAKAKFADLPRELQETVTKREAEREKFVQQKSQEAARARQEVEQAAYQQLAQYDRQVAEQLQQYAQQIGPRRPDPAMLQYDPAGFYAAQAQYEGHAAQQRELQQQAEEYAQQAQQREALAEQAFHAQQLQKLVEHFPEWQDPTTGPKLQQELTAVARELGYPPELISQARADDIIAMNKAAEWKRKADRLDKLEAKKMEKVRAAKGLPKVAKPGVPQGSEQLRANRATAAWERTKSSQGNARWEAAADWLKSTGQI